MPDTLTKTDVEYVSSVAGHSVSVEEALEFLRGLEEFEDEKLREKDNHDRLQRKLKWLSD